MTEATSRPKLGLSVSPQEAAWSELARVVRRADERGYDSLWTWDHLLGVGLDGRQRIFEGWTTIAAWAAITSRADLGLLACANTFRNPGIVAKSAVTVDHISGGRFILGLGAAYRHLEHEAHGIPFGSGPGERLAWLAESVATIRKLVAGEAVDSPAGGHYALRGASHNPLPVGGPGGLRILIPGAGERRTLRIVAGFGDLWHVRGTAETLLHKIEVLAAHCDAVGRPLSQIEFVTGNPVVIRDDPREAETVYETMVRRNGQTRGTGGEERAPGTLWAGPPEAIAEYWRPILELGFRHLVVDFPTPYDFETLERLPEVRELVAGPRAL